MTPTPAPAPSEPTSSPPFDERAEEIRVRMEALIERLKKPLPERTEN